ncbi:MAG: methyltransferase domain-containing protein [Chloroflexales bacterium]|nr:methyltransferase domain-containing protein [Chloroflexales bacterium]
MAKDKKRTAKPSKRSAPARRLAAQQMYRCEATVAAGLEDIAQDELRRRLGPDARLQALARDQVEPGVVRFDYTSDLRLLLQLQTVIAVFLVRQFAVPRPRALLGDEHFRALLQQIATACDLLPGATYQTLYLGAAGSDTAVMARLKQELSSHTGLAVAPDEGDLLIRVRRTADGTGWETLVRLSPRPLATRPWRVCNMEGALNATVARAMALLTQPKPNDCFLNLACGSGTLLIERLACGPARRAIGCDTGIEALACAQTNLIASGYGGLGELHAWDARALPLPAQSVDALCADLPFGNLVGSHAENLELYPALLAEAARVACPDALFVLITHEVRLMEALLNQSAEWVTVEVRRVTLGGLHPRIFVLRRH